MGLQSQPHDEFECFFKNFKSNLEVITQNDPFLVLASGDFNVKSRNWGRQ